ncbi:dienelactone hydrolase family protein [Roseomonas marmotae]|uniref:Dienelactone hydrolase family protein n=1 Tax=Roseomonas marmotae TaxID=2768161 RepID=A0ABS3KE13_9PROT|nr:dienelactone hydrolase family protein [Roseomonas marmotae]MBO1074898.1 dienelactone hydrolase family protein [Roseomonas marmotae]QTI80600.1 dienelactone hydrolase family protein [Roseomonas marmotae]
MPEITIPATDGSGSFSAYLAMPRQVPAGAVVMIQEIFGVNHAMRALSDWVADMGFIAISPDLFWRLEPGVQLTDSSEAEWQRAFDLMNRFDQAKGVEDLKATLQTARGLPGCNGKAGTMGFCLGGRLAFMMATQSDADVNISYYGVGIDGLLGDAGKIRAPLLLHIAERDRFVPAEAREKIVAGLADKPDVAVHVYPGVDHAFARMGGHSWDGRAATIANGRTAELLARVLG